MILKPTYKRLNEQSTSCGAMERKYTEVAWAVGMAAFQYRIPARVIVREVTSLLDPTRAPHWPEWCSASAWLVLVTAHQPKSKGYKKFFSKKPNEMKPIPLVAAKQFIQTSYMAKKEDSSNLQLVFALLLHVTMDYPLQTPCYKARCYSLYEHINIAVLIIQLPVWSVRVTVGSSSLWLMVSITPHITPTMLFGSVLLLALKKISM